MRNQFNDMVHEAGWSETSQVEVLLYFIEAQIRHGKITTDDFLDFMDESVADEKAVSDNDA